ncbi:hypothetical protein [Thermomonospora cellulosilytica]|uniref:Uncharacterized protein n=1 Tax=Thermomonospora cellulosilytica TaxID=1411118 RepID=A0A7W3MYX5_9ACTN|nr:hypothetical protein [Thermomonospora cellulosilytica]MBA9004448.1 hypothetical protein [Thermomonospora cellulosilytica]
MTTAQQSKAARKDAAEERERGGGVPIPVVTPHVKVLRVPTPPGVGAVAGAGRSAASHLPPPDRLAFYGGLGAMAAFNVISWPVAAAIGVGTAIARRGRGTEERAKPEEPGRTAEPARSR